MKKINYTIILSILVFLINACSDDFIDREPLARMSDEILFSSEQGALQTLTGCYDMMGRMETYRRNHNEIAECIADNCEVGGKAGNYEHAGAQDLSRFIATSDNETAHGYWKYHYRGIARCNEVIKRVPEIDMDEEIQARIVAEATFLRALYHFNLNNAFGGVPIADHPLAQEEYYETDRSSRLDVYLFIAEDLKKAREDLPVSYPASEAGRATKGAANALLAKTYLFIASFKEYDQYKDFNGNGFDDENRINADEYWQLAKETTELVMDGTYQLITEEQNIYDGEPYELTVSGYYWLFTLEGNNCKEKIFEVQHMDALSGTGGNYHEGNDIPKWYLVRDAIAPDGTPIPKPGFGFNTPTRDLYDAFEPEDQIRLKTTITTDEDSILWEYNDSIVWCMCDHQQSPTGYGHGKWRIIPPELHGGSGGYPATQNGFNIPILRYADVLLMHAEACMELGLEQDARNDLKLIRNRVGLSDYPTDPRYQDLKEAVYHERRVELATEGHRWFDILRWGRVKSELEGTSYGDNFIEGTHEYLAVPATEISISKIMKQNNGY